MPTLNAIMKDLFPYTDHFALEVVSQDKRLIHYETKIYKKYEEQLSVQAFSESLSIPIPVNGILI